MILHARHIHQTNSNAHVTSHYAFLSMPQRVRLSKWEIKLICYILKFELESENGNFWITDNKISVARTEICNYGKVKSFNEGKLWNSMNTFTQFHGPKSVSENRKWIIFRLLAGRVAWKSPVNGDWWRTASHCQIILCECIWNSGEITIYCL